MFNEKNRKRFASKMFNDQQRNIITMALMYFKNDYTRDDAEELGFDLVAMDDDVLSKGVCLELEAVAQELIEDLIGPTWDEEQTAINVATAQERMTRADRLQGRLFDEPEEE